MLQNWNIFRYKICIYQIIGVHGIELNWYMEDMGHLPVKQKPIFNNPLS